MKIEQSIVSTAVNDILSNGWFVNQTIAWWQAKLPATLSPQISCHKEWKNLLSLPKKTVVYFRNVDKRGRLIFKRHSHQTYWGSFMTEASYNAWFPQCDKLKAGFNEKRDETVSQYESLYGNCLEVGKVVGKLEWEWMHPGQGSPTETMIKEWGDRIWKTIPKKNELYNSFAYKTIEYRLRGELSDIEKRQFLQEVSDSFYQKVKSLSIEMTEEKRRCGAIRINMKDHFQDLTKAMVASWCFRSQASLEKILAFQAAMNEENYEMAIMKMGDLMEYVVPRFSSGLIGATEK